MATLKSVAQLRLKMMKAISEKYGYITKCSEINESDKYKYIKG